MAVPPHDVAVAPDGAVFFSTFSGVARLDPTTNELTTWAVRSFHITIGPSLSLDLGGQAVDEPFTVGIVGPLGASVALLLPRSSLLLQWELPFDVNDITASGSHLWASRFSEGETTQLASLDPRANLLTTYDLPQGMAGSAGVIFGLSYGGGRVWYGVYSSQADGSPSFEERVGSLNPSTREAKVWTLISQTIEGGGLIGRAATFSAGATWTFYHSTEEGLRGAYRLNPASGGTRRYTAPLGEPSPFYANRADRATMAGGAVWAVTTSRLGGVGVTQVVRWQPAVAATENTLGAESLVATVAEAGVTPTWKGLDSSSTVLTSTTLPLVGSSPAPGTTVWSIEGSFVGHFAPDATGTLYFDQSNPATGGKFLARLTT